jgi:gliding motility-associated-like protein
MTAIYAPFKKIFSLLALCPVTATGLFAQQNFALHSDWSVTDPFHQSGFISNVSQFDGKDGNKNSNILFGIANDGVEVYFTSTGYTYKHTRVTLPEREEGERTGRTLRGRIREEEREMKPEYEEQFVHVEWVGANPSPVCEYLDPVSHYYTYGDVRDKTGHTSLKAYAYKRILVKDLYPGIDVEYTVPEGKSGIKYALILHPGADLALVKMKYSGDEGMALDDKGNVVIKSKFGDIVDHAPLTCYADNRSPVGSIFSLQKNEVSFKVANHSAARTLVIDPWSSVPTFTGYNGSYDCDFDNAGGMYVYGGTFPWQMIKFNSAGVQQWVYSSTPFNSTWSYYYGDFCVDHTSGSSYQVESINTGIGTQVIKLNSNGTQLVVFPGNVQLEEGWRIAYDQCNDKIVIAGGGVSYYNQGGTIDTSCTTLSAVNVINYNEIGHDMCYLTLDKAGMAYMATTNYGNTNYNNRMLKMNETTLAPTIWMVADGYTFQEGGNLTYISGGANQASGYNGICASPNFLYTCDGVTLKKWDKATGTLLQSAVIAGTPRTCGGMDVDDCDNIYIGVQSAVNKYDVNLNLLGSTPTTNIVYDLKLGPNNKLYASGKNFAQELTIVSTCTQGPMTINMTSTGSSCSSNSGTATATPTGGVGPYTYSWVPGGQTTQTITGLSSGTYTVYITDSGCPPITQQATVTVTNSGSLSVTASQTNLQCASSTNGSATVTVNGGQSPYTYSWTPSGGSNSTATGLGPGMYTVYVTDASGCSTTQTFTLTAPPALTLALTPTNIQCNGGTGSASANAGGGTGPYTYSWNNAQTNSNATGLSAGTYTCVITDANGCTMQQTVTITQPSAITASASPTNTSCGNSNGSATVTASGGTGTLTYSWAPSGGSGSTASGLSPGSYTVYITDANGCTQTSTVNIAPSTAPTATLASQTNLLCASSANGTASVTVNGGASPYTYSWNNAQTAANATGLGPGTYTCYVTDASGCTTTQTVTITAPPPITAAAASTFASCGSNDGTATATANGGTGTLTYSWSPGGGSSATITGLAVGNYTCVITDANGCTQTVTTTVTNASGPTATVSPDVTIQGGSSTNISATGGGSYSWTPSSGLSCTTCANPVASPTSTTQYCVFVTDQGGCSDSACMTVTVDIPCPSNADFTAPNAFSPNGDGHNDVFTLQGLRTCVVEFKFIIYDRWGEKVFETTDITLGWDGTYKGNALDPAVFIYYVSATLSNGTEIVKRGNISLIR